MIAIILAKHKISLYYSHGSLVGVGKSRGCGRIGTGTIDSGSIGKGIGSSCLTFIGNYPLAQFYNSL